MGKREDQHGVGLLSDVFDDLGKPIDASRLAEVPGAIEQGQFNPGNLCEAGFALEASEPVRLVDLNERCRGLIDNLKPVTADFEVTKLLWNDDLESLGRLVR